MQHERIVSKAFMKSTFDVWSNDMKNSFLIKNVEISSKFIEPSLLKEEFSLVETKCCNIELK